MTLTPEQLEQRRNFVGASESAALFGVSPFAKKPDIYHRKVMDLEPDAPTAAMENGNRLEPALIRFAADKLGIEVIANCPTVIHPQLPMGATPDALVVGKPEGIEAKFTGFSEGWGDEGTDQIPDHYLIQCHHQMRVLELERVWVPVFMLMGYRAEWRLYCVERDDAIEKAIEDEVSDFWFTHVVPRIPPEGGEVAPLDFLKRLRREPKSQVPLDEDAEYLLDCLDNAKAKAKEVDDLKKDIQAKLLTKLGEAEAGLLPDGRLITYLEQRSAPSVDHTRLRAEFTDAYAACVTQGKCRVLRVKTPKGWDALRDAKARAHVAFDTLWQKGLFTRGTAYAWLYQTMGIGHIAEMDVKQCEQLIALCEEKFPEFVKGK